MSKILHNDYDADDDKRAMTVSRCFLRKHPNLNLTVLSRTFFGEGPGSWLLCVLPTSIRNYCVGTCTKSFNKCLSRIKLHGVAL